MKFWSTPTQGMTVQCDMGVEKTNAARHFPLNYQTPPQTGKKAEPTMFPGEVIMVIAKQTCPRKPRKLLREALNQPSSHVFLALLRNARYECAMQFVKSNQKSVAL